MKHSCCSRILSFVIAFSMFLQIMPLQQFAVNVDATVNSDSGSNHVASVLGEVESLRKEDTKHFRLSDGSFIAVSYGMPVHYESADGKWEDIDNSISLDSGGETYQLNRSDALVAFSNTLADGTVLTTSMENASISMSLLDTSQALQLIADETTEKGSETAIPEAEHTKVNSVEIGVEPIDDEMADDFTLSDAPATEGNVSSIEETITEILYEEAETAKMQLPNEEGTTAPEEDTVFNETVEDLISVDSTTRNTLEFEELASTPIPTVSFDRSSTVHIIEDAPATFTYQEDHGWSMDDITPTKIQSSWIYEEVFPDVDLKYTAYGNNIKEEIIVKEPQEAYRYDFLLKLEGLSAELNGDGSVSLVDTAGTQKYFIPTPLMKDANGIISYDVDYTLSENTQGVVLTVEADSAWINSADRSFPVSIDPTVEVQARQPHQTILSNYVMEGEPNSTAVRIHLRVGATTQSFTHDGRFRLFLYFEQFPDIPVNAEIIDASLVMTMVSGQYIYSNMDHFPIGVYDVTDDKPSRFATYRAWLESFTWNTQPNYDNTFTLDYQTVHDRSSEVQWDITKLVKQWYANDDDNRIIMLKMMNEGDLEPYTNYASTAFEAYYDRSGPKLVVSYRNDTGIEPYFTYATLEGLSSGTAYVSDATGQLIVAKELLGYASTSNPFYLNLLYNSDYFTSTSGADYIPPTELGMNMSVGSGWTMNCIQKVYPDSTKENRLLYHDGDGTIHNFGKCGGVYLDEDGLGLEISITESGDYLMSDQDGNQWTFSDNLLSSIKDADGNEILITKNSEKQITSIKQKNNGQSEIVVATFTYDGNSLNKVTDYAGNEYTLLYSNGDLAAVKRNNTSIAEYSYVDHRLSSMKDMETGYSLVFSYGDDGKVYSYKESNGSVTGAYVQITHPGNGQTIYRDSGLDRTLKTADDVLTYYLFDNANRTVNAYSTDSSGKILGASNAVYYTFGEEEINRKDNKTYRTSSIGIAAQQLLRNTGLEADSADTAWTLSGTGLSISTVNPRTGLYSLSGTQSITGMQSAQTTSEILTAGETYTFSGYINTSDAKAAENTIGIYLKVMDSDGNTWTSVPVDYNTSLGNDENESNTLAYDVQFEWVRVSTTFTAKVSGPHSLYVCNDGMQNTFYADDFQLEIGDAPSNYNLVENGNMEMSTYSWTMVGGGSSIDTTMGTEHSSSSLKINGDPEVERYAYQDIPLNLPGSQTYVLSGWAYTNAVADNVNHETNIAKDKQKQCGLRAAIYYSDKAPNEDPEYHYIAFNTQVADQWQFVSKAIVPEKPERTVEKIQIICAYETNANICRFDNVSLVREASQTMTYDDDGNLKSVSTSGLSEDVSTYENGNLIKTITGGYGTFDYAYDETYEHRLESVTNGKITQEMGYDGVGNVTSTDLSAENSKTIETSATYDATGNRLVSLTDATGATVNYSYDGSKSIMMGLPTAVTAPNGTVTTSVYDSYGRVTQTGIAETATLLYTYSNGNLSSVKRTDDTENSQTYVFTYDGFGNMTKALVGTRELATYTYGTGNGLLTKQIYGNKDEVSLTYDELGRTKTVTYDDGRVLTYTYNGAGSLYSITESNGGNTYTYLYDYDSLGRLSANRKLANGSLVLRTGQHFNEHGQVDFQAWQTGQNSYFETFSYDSTDGSLIEIEGSDGTSQSITYDKLSRLSRRLLTKSNSTILTEDYTYRDIGNNGTTTQVSEKKISAGNLEIITAYTYDISGNILSATQTFRNGTASGTTEYTATYVYDDQNQLIRENNQAAGKTWTWTYDTVGNILNRKEYAYTTGTLGSVLDTITYAYGNSEWQDLLTAYDSNTITYDEIGNPLNDGKRIYTWQNGRQLAAMESLQSDETVEFSYDASGLRTNKTVVTGIGATHVHSYTSSVVAPTCMDGGYTLHTCSCGYNYKTDPTAARGHFYATSTSICTRCGSAQHTHSYTSTVVAPTCTAGGYTLHTCQCGNSYKDTETAARGHFYTTATAPCTRCGHKQGESVSSNSTTIKEYNYIYSGDTLVEMDIRTIEDNGTPAPDVLTFTYDNNGYPATVTSNGNTYYYVTNLQGDVTAILNASKAIVVQYTYDAWGRVLSTTGSLATTLGATNPLRYRGYVYDTESGLYYLQSRYYDPEMGRFLNADILTSTGQGILGHNMFAYCVNNPVVGYDPSGLVNWGGVAVGLFIGALAVVSVAATIATAGAASPLIAAIGLTVGTAVSAALIETSAVTTVGAFNETPVVYDITATSNRDKVGCSVVYDFETNISDVYLHEGVQSNNEHGVTYGAGFVYNYDEPGDYAGEFYDASFSMNYNGANIGVDGCTDPNNVYRSGNGSWAVLLTSGWSINLDGRGTPINFSYDYYWPVACLY